MAAVTSYENVLYHHRGVQIELLPINDVSKCASLSLCKQNTGYSAGVALVGDPLQWTSIPIRKE